MPAAVPHHLTKRQIYRHALQLRSQGRLYNTRNAALDDVFKGSIDRFCDIAFRLRASKKILDVGAGHGMLLSLLHELGHECCALDIADNTARYPEVYREKPIHFQVCNVEVDPIPFADGYFDAVVCCQVLEHFTHSHLKAMKEMHRVLRHGGIVEVDVPNAVSFRNRSRMLRGKNITYDYEKHYLYALPVSYKGMSFYPDRHNREFTKSELRILLEAGNFNNIEIVFLKSRRHREGLEKIRTVGTMLKDAIPSLRKSLIAFAEK
ncbi:MAG TPA: methyltransferase domain-containing protein [Burkholderiales bacterium]|nr:methyltransferase domain-containing protein [Burkholderiales bacterium]